MIPTLTLTKELDEAAGNFLAAKNNEETLAIRYEDACVATFRARQKLYDAYRALHEGLTDNAALKQPDDSPPQS
jgi:hypothetical protein